MPLNGSVDHSTRARLAARALKQIAHSRHSLFVSSHEISSPGVILLNLDQSWAQVTPGHLLLFHPARTRPADPQSSGQHSAVLQSEASEPRETRALRWRCWLALRAECARLIYWHPSCPPCGPALGWEKRHPSPPAMPRDFLVLQTTRRIGLPEHGEAWLCCAYGSSVLHSRSEESSEE
jgi:hypothetical protein